MTPTQKLRIWMRRRREINVLNPTFIGQKISKWCWWQHQICHTLIAKSFILKGWIVPLSKMKWLQNSRNSCFITNPRLWYSQTEINSQFQFQPNVFCELTFDRTFLAWNEAYHCQLSPKIGSFAQIDAQNIFKTFRRDSEYDKG